MDAAKQAISGFLHKDGKHTTHVDESVNPAVTNETVKPHQHEEVTKAVDKEVHQDHYHTTVQPISHREVLPEQHKHNVAPQVEREYVHGNAQEDQSRVASELGQFRDTSTVQNATTSASAQSAVGEHTHHHVHENVQPVIQKETVAPEVVHTTIPVHEKHHAPSEHHGLSVLPTKSLNEVTQQGGSLTGGQHNKLQYEGDPRPYDSEFQQERKPVDVNPAAHDGLHGHGDNSTSSTGLHGHTGQSTSGTGFGSSTGLGSSTGNQGLHQSSGTHHDSGLATGGALAGARAAVSGSHHQHNEQDRGLSSGTGLSSGVGSSGSNFGNTSGTTQSSGLTSGDNFTSGHNTSHEQTSTSGQGFNQSTTGGSSFGTGDHHGLDSASHTRDAASTSTEGVSHREPTNLTGGTAERKDISRDDNVQHASIEGTDPSLEKNKSDKLTGTGKDGSHSAVFGLTPDGHTHDDTSRARTTAPITESESEGKTSHRDSGTEDIGSRGTGSGKVAEQLHDPRIAEKNHGGATDHGTDNNKPGHGLNTSEIV